MSPRTKMGRLKTMEETTLPMTNSSSTKKWETFAISTAASWIWGTLATEKEFSWRSQISDPTGNLSHDAYNPTSFIYTTVTI